MNFNQTVSTNSELQALEAGLGSSNASSYVELLWYGEGLTSTSAFKGSVNLFGSGTTATLSLSGSDLSINFGAGGVTSLLTETGLSGTGTPTSNFGDGWYALGIDLAGNYSQDETIWLPFYRLFGSALGNETVSGPYTTANTDAYVVHNAEGESGPLLNADVDGSGAVNSKDLAYTIGANGDSVDAVAPATFPQFQLLAGGGPAAAAASANGTLITQQEAQSLVPAAIAGWQAAGLDAAQLRKLASTQVLVGNLGSSILGEETLGVITINQTAAGDNWYVGAGSGSNQAFALAGPRGELIATPGSAAANAVDLLTVLEHELGHVIGLADNTEIGDLMDITLGAGVRREPNGADVAAIGSTPPEAIAITGAGSTGQGVAPLGAAAGGQKLASPAQPQPVTQATIDAALAALTTIAAGNGDEQDPTATSVSPSRFVRRYSRRAVKPKDKSDTSASGLPHPRGALFSAVNKQVHPSGQAFPSETENGAKQQH